MIGIGATEMAGVLVSGEIWVRVPPTILVRWSGRLQHGVVAKDMMLALCARLGINGANYRVVEYAGSAVEALSMPERMVLTNMAAELGAKTGLIAPDAVTVAALTEAGVEQPDALDWRGDTDATYERVLDLAAGELSPQVAAPHSPENVAPVAAHAGVAIDQAYIGACTGAKLSDLRMAAEVLRGRKVAPGVRFLVAPASTRVTHQAAEDGTLATLTGAGAIVLPTGCGACAGFGAGVLAEDETCIASTARNYKGRMGAPSARVYLGSPYTVAASAVRGRIGDPRELLG
jgi:3-isopropylmalate/(R)-2-methylmalate dehydratase large subunit